MVVYKAKVLRTAYQGIPQDSLPVFAGRVVKKTKNNPVYSDMRLQVTALDTANAAFRILLEDALGGSSADIARKDAGMVELLKALDAVAQYLDDHAAGNPLFIIDAGMQAQKAAESHTAKLGVPGDVVAESNGQPGQAVVTYTAPPQGGIQMYAGEWSLDQELWHNGTYRKGTRMVFENLPSQKLVYFRVFAIGTRGRKSDPTNGSASCSVL